MLLLVQWVQFFTILSFDTQNQIKVIFTFGSFILELLILAKTQWVRSAAASIKLLWYSFEDDLRPCICLIKMHKNNHGVKQHWQMHQ